MLQDPDRMQRVAALISLRDAGASALPSFLWALDNEEAAVCIAAVKSLGPQPWEKRPLSPPSTPRRAG
jgi:hypothetical protein